jgi:hypothetical protein
MAADFAPLGIMFNAISLGEIDTAILSPCTETLIADIPMRRLGQPEEVAKAIYFLCTVQSSYINGSRRRAACVTPIGVMAEAPGRPSRLASLAPQNDGRASNHRRQELDLG